MIYYAGAFTILGNLHTTPLRSLTSKMVEPNEFGKIFTFVGVAISLAQLISSSLLLEVYADTVASFPGFMYLVSAGLACLALVITNLQLQSKVRMLISIIFLKYITA